MSREFHIAGNVYAVAEFSTAASWHFVLHARDSKLPNVSSVIGTIDVHYPCHSTGAADGDPAGFRATIVLDPESIEPNDTKLTSDEIHAALKREFSISDDANWSFGYYECADGLEGGFDSNAYY
jgi:hypothetical protein